MAQLKERISSIIDGGIDNSEVSQIEELKQEFSCLSPEAKKEVEVLLDTALASASEEAKMAISELKNSICEAEETPRYTLEKLTQRKELTHIKDAFFGYFEQQAKQQLSGLSLPEQESLKILLWSDFLSFFGDTSALGIFMDTIESKTGGAIQGLSEIESTDTNDLNTLLEKAEKMFSEFTTLPEFQDGFQTVMEEKFGAHIERVKKIKEANPDQDISDLRSLKNILEGEDTPSLTSEQIYKDIEKQSEDVANSIGGKQKMGAKLAETIDNLPMGMGNSIKDFIKGLVEKWPFLGILVGLIMGPDFLGEFLSEEDGKRKKSLQSLFALSEKSNSPLSGIFGKEFAESFDSKKVEGFFKYLESEKIDYSNDDFWNELITGDSTNVKIQDLSKLLKGEYGKNIFEKKDSENNGELFIKKLNSVEELSYKEELQIAEKDLETSAAALAVIPLVTPQVTIIPKKSTSGEEESKDSPGESPAAGIEQTPDTTPQQDVLQVPSQEVSEKVQQEYRNFRDDVIETSLKNAFSFPITLSYKGKEQELKTLGIETPKNIDFKNGTLSIDGKIFSTKFESFSVTKYGQTFTVDELQIIGNPTLTRNTLELECQTENLGILAGVQKAPVPLEKTKMIEIVHALIKTGKYSGKIPAQDDTPEISFEIS